MKRGPKGRRGQRHTTAIKRVRQREVIGGWESQRGDEEKDNLKDTLFENGIVMSTCV